jgi:hypothetical protein
LLELLQVEPSTERSARACEDDDLDRFVGAQSAEPIDELVAQGHRQSVAALGTVEGEHGDRGRWAIEPSQRLHSTSLLGYHLNLSRRLGHPARHGRAGLALRASRIRARVTSAHAGVRRRARTSAFCMCGSRRAAVVAVLVGGAV